jgi:hypothetical protein
MEDGFWRRHDPDLTTPENEAELNFMARVAHALLLFRDERGVRWDMRAELFARYGIPDSIQLHPPQALLEYSVTRYVHNEYAPPPIYFPYNEQIWSYTSLGMRVVLWDRSLHQVYELPVVHEYSNDPRPDPAAIAARPDLVLLGDGRGVYRALPPGVTSMAVRAQLSRFPADSGARLVAILEAPGGPTEALQGSWAVVTAEGRQVARGSGALSVSACEPGELRFANFDAEVPPGDYRVDVAVADGHGRRGVAHLRAAVVPPPGPLALSDLVLLCGPEAAASEGSAIRIEPSFERRLGHARSVAVYFEVDHLVAGPGGASRFAYTYAIRPAVASEARGPRPERVFEATREEENVGPHRRQFVSAPLQSLAAGAYDFEIVVRDLVSGASVSGSIQFAKE